jgi:hypothetical protein
VTAVEWGTSLKAQLLQAKYDLVANVCHDSSGAQVRERRWKKGGRRDVREGRGRGTRERDEGEGEDNSRGMERDR